MRTTLDIDDDVLRAVKELSAREGISAGKLLSRVARKGLLARASVNQGLVSKNGVSVFPSSEDEIIHLGHVQELMDEEGI